VTSKNKLALRSISSILRISYRTIIVLSLFVCGLSNIPASAQDTYRRPPQAVLDVLNAPATPFISVSPTRDRLLMFQPVRYPPISDVSQPMLRLAGLRINPNTNGLHRAPYYTALTVKRISDGVETQVQLPANPRISAPQWSHNGRRFAFTNTLANGIELWVGEAETGRVRRIENIRISAVYGDPIQWMPDNRTLLVQLIPANRRNVPGAPTTPAGPVIQESSGRQGPVRTFQDLLRNPHDELLFEYYATAQLALLDTTNGRATNIGQPAIFQSIEPAPDGEHLLVARIKRPFSYLYPAFAFPREVEVWTRAGRMAHRLADLPLADTVPIDGVPTGPRSYTWRPTETATLVWVEALDEGDPRRQVPHRDRILMLRAPFTGQPTEVARLQHRFAGMQWGERAGVMFARDYDRNRRWARTFILNADNRDAQPRVLFDLSINDRYNDPGSFVIRRLPNGQSVVMQQGDTVYLTGAGASPQGDRPFFDRFNLSNGQKERLFHSSADAYESFVALLDDNGRTIITRRESLTEPPNYFVRTLQSNATTQGTDTAAAARALTNFPDPTPALRGIRKQLVTYNRADGVPLSFTLYLPPGYREGTRLPTIVWAYPLEFSDAATAGQVSGSTQRFTSITGASHLFFLLNGYAVLDNATMPVVGSDIQTVNDTFIQQITQSAQAAIDKAVEMGVTDRERVGVGGHSYGAFMTANLLAHTDLFRAGIARSGAYNRTLTPFGFQGERRTFWEASQVYMNLSPFTFAHRINEPILLIHGEADDNSGTFPIQSERMYQAVRGNGGNVRYVVLPAESHGYAARESIEHTLYEMLAWFDRHVKNAPPRNQTPSAGGASTTR
jgi:dipeptidyl aminopeptidase/acylaminoacyl peptidase